jgi:hypothetical protein
MNEKNSTSCPRNTPTNVRPEDFKILEKMSYENHDICQYLIVLYAEVVVKIWVGFAKFSRTMLTNGNISGEDQRVENDMIKFESKLMSNLSSASKAFSTSHIQYMLLHV